MSKFLHGSGHTDDATDEDTKAIPRPPVFPEHSRAKNPWSDLLSMVRIPNYGQGLYLWSKRSQPLFMVRAHIHFSSPIITCPWSEHLSMVRSPVHG